MKESEIKKSKTKRLHFGVIFPSLDNTEKYNLLGGIEAYAVNNDIHITAFFGTFEAMTHEFASNYTPCFEIIKRSKMFDGMIIYSSFIAHNIGTELFIENVRVISEHIPVVSIGVELPGAYCVMADNETSMYNAVNHLITVHGRKRIALIKGPEGHPEGEARMAGYLKALADNGLEYDEALVIPGDWRPQCGIDAVVELVDKRRIPFDAIASTDDDSALSAMETLARRNIKVPADVSVTGFNDIDEATLFTPQLSSLRQDFSRYGATAADILARIAAGKKVAQVTQIAPKFIIRASCGCNKKTRKRSHWINTRSLDPNMHRRMATDSLLLQFSYESLVDIMFRSFSMVSVDFAAVGIYGDDIRGGIRENRQITALFGYDGDKKFYNGDLEENVYPFADYDSITGLDMERKRRTLFFLPMFFGNEENGEILIAYNNYNPVNWYENVRRNVTVAVKGAGLIRKIEFLSITDELTGLFNRRGFFQQSQARLLYLQRRPEYVSVIFALDMDGLKVINDTYGHGEGDKAIKAFAQILKDSVRAEDIVGRLGGDEFVIFSIMKSDDNVALLENRIREKTERYNEANDLQYKIGTSIGSAIVKELTPGAFDKAMFDADNILYKEKQIKKAAGKAR